MKRLILIIDLFTNGHEAALEFIKRQGWNIDDCVIEFCTTHHALLQRLTETRAYAVIPVHNSTLGVGEVKEATEPFQELIAFGYDLRVIDEMGLQINHCLLVRKDVTDIGQLDEIHSHPKALQQCQGYLDKNGIPPEKRIEVSSTGAAARAVAQLGTEKNDKKNIGAIAPRMAAENPDYGLKVLDANIQDQRDNITTFKLLYNPFRIKPKVVGIIGHGGFGKVFDANFTSFGCQVIHADPKEQGGMTNEDVVINADVVLFAVPARRAVEIIRSVSHLSHANQLFIDITSFKHPPLMAMLESKAQVVGLHPMFAPSVAFHGQTIVACDTRLDDPAWRVWVLNVLAATRARITWCHDAGEEHDHYMTRVQGATHTASLANAILMMESGDSVARSLEFTSPFYRVMLSLIGRLLSQDSELYASILMDNPETLAMLDQRIEIELRLRDIVARKDYDAFKKLFEDLKVYFGPQIIREQNEFFQRLLVVQRTLYGKNTVRLRVPSKHNKRGLLVKILSHFDAFGVDLKDIISFVHDGYLEFSIAVVGLRNSADVRTAIDWAMAAIGDIEELA